MLGSRPAPPEIRGKKKSREERELCNFHSFMILAYLHTYLYYPLLTEFLSSCAKGILQNQIR